jgi:hypothetical protein
MSSLLSLTRASSLRWKQSRSHWIPSCIDRERELKCTGLAWGYFIDRGGFAWLRFVVRRR